jgi:hypothetical protein
VAFIPMFVFGLRPSTIDWMSEGSLSQAWEMLAIAPTAQNRRLIAAAMTEDFAELGRVVMDATTARNWYRIREDQLAQTRRRSLIGAGVPQNGGPLRQQDHCCDALRRAG